MSDQLIEYVNYLKDTKGLSDRTAYHYLTYYRRFDHDKISQNNINKFLQDRKNNSVCRGFMRSYLEFLKLQKVYDLPPIKTGQGKKRLIRQISIVEINKIRDYAYLTNKRDGIIFDLLYFGALRRFEILDIRTNSFNWNKWFLDPTDFCEFNIVGKGNKERTVLVHPKAINTLLEIYFEKELINNNMDPSEITQKLNSMDDILFKKMTEWKVWNIVKKYSTMALKRDLRTHEIRHARATQLEENGATIRDIQKYLGHSSLAVTEIYLHTDPIKSLKRIKAISKTF